MSTFTFVDESQTTLIIVIAMIGKSAISGGWAATQVFSAETFPTVVRLVIDNSRKIHALDIIEIHEHFGVSSCMKFLIFDVLEILALELVPCQPE